jgi:hypothetical protein
MDTLEFIKSEVERLARIIEVRPSSLPHYEYSKDGFQPYI